MPSQLAESIRVVSPVQLARLLAENGVEFVAYGDLALFLHTGHPNPPRSLSIAPKLNDPRSFDALAATLNELEGTVNGLRVQFAGPALAKTEEIDIDTNLGPVEIRHYPAGVTRGMSGYDDLIRRPRTIHLAEGSQK